MADSDHSTSLSSVTRRRLLVGTATVSLASALHTFGPGGAETPEEARHVADIAFSLWQEWLTAYEKTAAACHKQQQLETRLAKEVGFPPILVPVAGEPDPVPIFSMEELDDLLGGNPETSSLRARSSADLIAHQARWDAADGTIGYSQAKHAEEEAAERQRQLVETLWAAPAHSLAGVAAKLDAILTEGEWCQDCPEFPWPQIRGALADLVRIGRLENVFQDTRSLPKVESSA
jgi:hypothetical protein